MECPKCGSKMIEGFYLTKKNTFITWGENPVAWYCEKCDTITIHCDQ